MNKKLPKRLKSILWSYDISKMDLKKDQREIITQVLNYGVWEDLKWLYRTYSEAEIKQVVKNPRSGVWFKDVLKFWTTLFNLRIKKDIYQKAIFDINPPKH